jgi:hypothetical protein
MNKNERQKIDREFDAADAAIARAVTAFTNKIERMSGDGFTRSTSLSARCWCCVMK